MFHVGAMAASRRERLLQFLVVLLLHACPGAGGLSKLDARRCAAVHARPIVPFRTKKLPKKVNPRVVLDLDLARTGGALAARNASAAVRAMSGPQRDAWTGVLRGLVGAESPPPSGVTTAPSSAPELRVLVLGGSMLAGGCCDDRIEPRWSPTCTYAKRFVDALARNYRRMTATGVPGALPRIEYQSLATGGTTSEGVLPSLPAMIGRFGEDAAAGMPTLLLVDYSVNDAWEVGMGGQPRLAAAVEAFLRYMLQSHPRIALILAETYAGRDAHTPNPIPGAYGMAARYGVPHMRYALAVRDWSLAWGLHCGLPGPSVAEADGAAAATAAALASDSRPVVPVAPRGGHECSPHPSWTTHQLIADVALYTTISLLVELCAAPPPSSAAGGAAVAAGSGGGGLAHGGWNSEPLGSGPGEGVRLPPPASSVELLSQTEVCERPSAAFSAAELFGRQRRVAGVGAGTPGAAGGNTGAPTIAGSPSSPDLNAVGTGAPAAADMPVAAGPGSAVESGVRVTAGNWTLYEDRRNKPGWITSGPVLSTLEFRLAFGARPRITLAYLRGYDEALGTVELSMRDVVMRAPPGHPGPPPPLPRSKPWVANRARLRARRMDGVRVSQTAVLAIKADDERMQNYAMARRIWAASFNGVIGFGIPPYASATLVVSLVCERCNCSQAARDANGGRACKFKILSVVAC